MSNSPRLNIAFDAKSADDLVQFVRDHVAKITPDLLPKIHIKVNDLLALTGIE